MTKLFSVLCGLVAALAWAVVIAIPVWFLITTMGAKVDLWASLDAFRHVRTYAQYAIFGALGVGAVSLVVLIVSRFAAGVGGAGAFLGAILAVVIGGGGLMAAKSAQDAAASVPPIHDISTDLTDPPQFSRAMIERREQIEGVNSVDLLDKQVPDSDWTGQWGGRAVTDVQAEAYPDIETLYLTAGPAQAYEASLAAARDLGWRITTASRDSLMFEGTVESFWFSFKDDFVVRITEAENGSSAIDVRSVSRVGLSDLGANAERVRAFIDAVRDATGSARDG
ncbi:DUF1499 domain-containing protein [Marinicauda sp. Alg238-R41]|uniref:DUF1499 domain-containing protein n=1 Tax=Marinicauda sp. Alg238-R41 TaxID=2993447 RepID=UPI0022DED178|nr:DUF1499 domain-containing protein [Marinicauda sp. Alg238-R41]